MHEIELRHTIDAGHRVVDHEGGNGKCARLHGHTYGFKVVLVGDLIEKPPFVVDFAQIKDELNAWDHRLLLWAHDPIWEDIDSGLLADYGCLSVPFNPTAENISRYFAKVFVAEFKNVLLAQVEVSETPKSTARWTERR